MSAFMHQNGLLFIPSVGPGYNDTLIRPWNAQNTKSRGKGRYFQNNFHDAIDAKPDLISITSYNEWGEGTQIEPSETRHHSSSGSSHAYTDYGNDPALYLGMTQDFVTQFVEEQSNGAAKSEL